MEKSDRTEKREAIRTVEKGKHTGKIAPLSAGKQATAKTDSKEEINGQRTMRKVEQKMKKTIFEEMGGTYVRCGDYFIPQPYFAGGRRTEICWSMGTKTFAVFERIPQECISGSDDERQTEQLSGRYRGTGTGTL